ncbi:hypothetical protein [Roseococcus pinisoli]|uniref:Uncharacterized protein n=1 Tax=Roseococcus pinisoli TaxID=2835040 RepID=A0ABS5QHN3_9PROT|nr:hypothetical protein [Roseococcus pinisoli]MBS7812858.1 hypothetical protein [Roseococcus pinisoli]
MPDPSNTPGSPAAEHLQPTAWSRRITPVGAPVTAQDRATRIFASGADEDVASPAQMADSYGFPGDAEAPMKVSLTPVFTNEDVASPSPHDPAFMARVCTMRTTELEREFPEEHKRHEALKAKARRDRSIVIHPDLRTLKGYLLVMGEMPGPGYSTDCIDRSGRYAPGNVRWATNAEQTRNRGCTVTVTAFGREPRPLAAWCDDMGQPYPLVYQRIHRGKWTVEEALLGKRLPAAAPASTVTTLDPSYVANDWIKSIPAPVLAAWKERYPAFLASVKKWTDGEGAALSATRREKLARIYLTKAVFTVCQLDQDIRVQTSRLHQAGIDLHDPDLADELLNHPGVRRFNMMHDLRRRASALLTREQRDFTRGALFTSPGMAEFVRKMGWQAPPAEPDQRCPMWMRPLSWARTDAEREEWAADRAAWIAGRPAREAARAAREVRARSAEAEAEAEARREYEARREAEYARARAAAAEHAQSRAADVGPDRRGLPPSRPASADVIDLTAVRAARAA